MRTFARAGVATVAALVLITGITAGTPAAQGTTPAIANRPYVGIGSVAGKDNFDAYCAVCHGKEAKGNGPAAPAMKAVVPDLTALAARHDGKFDRAAVEYAIRGTGKMATPAHGVQGMPIWGSVFEPTSTNRGEASMRVANLVKYLETIQVPGAGSATGRR